MLFSCCSIFMSRLFPVKLSSSCTLFMLTICRIAFFSFFSISFTFHVFFVLPFFMLHFFHAVLFSFCTFFILQFFRVALFLCFDISMLHFFPVALFSWCLFLFHSFHVALSSCCTYLFFMCYVTSVIILKHTTNQLQLSIFPRWSVLALHTCCSRKRIKAPMECDRCIVIRIENNIKSFSTNSKVSLNQNFLQSLRKVPGINFWQRFFFEKAVVILLSFAILGLHRRRLQRFIQTFKDYLPERIRFWLVLVDFQLSTYYHRSVFRTLPNTEVRAFCESCLVLLQMFDQGSKYAFDIKYHKLLKTNKRKKTQPQKKSLRSVP